MTRKNSLLGFLEIIKMICWRSLLSTWESINAHFWGNGSHWRVVPNCKLIILGCLNGQWHTQNHWRGQDDSGTFCRGNFIIEIYGLQVLRKIVMQFFNNSKFIDVTFILWHRLYCHEIWRSWIVCKWFNSKSFIIVVLKFVQSLRIGRGNI